MRRLIIIPILIIVSLVLVYLIYNRQQSSLLPPDLIYSSGTVEANTVTIAAQLAGKVLEKRFDKGDFIQPGDTLVFVERELLEARRQELNAARSATQDELAAAQIELANLRRNLDRLRQAYAAGSIPKRSYDDLQAGVDAGARRIAALQAKLQSIDAQEQSLAVQIGYATVVSAVSGFIQSAPLEVGELAAAGATLFEIVDLSDTWVEIYVNETEIPNVHLGDSAKVHLDSQPEQPVTGTVSFISQRAEFTPKNVQTRKERIKLVFAVRVKVDNRDGRFKPGLPVDVYLKKS